MDNKNTLLNNISTLNGEGIDINALPTYKRVTWENGAGPAINADNLNRIEDALEALLGSNETSGIVQDFSIQINTDGKNIKSLSENKVDKTTTINNHALGENITLTKSDVGLDKVENKSSREILNELQSSDVLSVLPVATSSDLGAVRSGGDITIDAKGKVTVNKASTLTGLDATVAELNNIKGTSSPVQTQINNVSTNISSLSTELNTVKNSYVTKDYVDKKIDDIVIPEGGEVDLTNYYTKEEVDNKIPTKISAFTNDSNYLTTTAANNTFVSKTTASNFITKDDSLKLVCGTSISI